MNENPSQLDKITSWMQAVIRHPGGVEEGMLSSEAIGHIRMKPEHIEHVLTASKNLSASDRLAIYNRAYHYRLSECLRAQYPCLLHFFGDDIFNLLVKEYLEVYPSRSYTLHDLGGKLPDYLAETRPDIDVPQGEQEMWPAFIIELATLERAFYETYNGPGEEQSEPLTISDLESIDNFTALKLKPSNCVGLHKFQYPVNHYFRDVRLKKDPDLPHPFDTFLVISRKNYIVRTYEISGTQYGFLQALFCGRTVGEASSFCEIQSATAFSWISEWLTFNFFCKK